MSPLPTINKKKGSLSMTYLLGLTGGIASGKSTVSQVFKDKGVQVVDADRIARQVVEPGSPGLDQLVDYFGQEILTQEGDLDRKRLGDLIFRDDQSKEVVNRILHPLIGQSIQGQIGAAIDQDLDLLVLDIPLLYETGQADDYQAVMVVSLPYQDQVSRLMDRDGIDRDQALRKIQAQMSLEEKVKLADYVIDNSGSKEETRQQVEAWMDQKGFKNL